MRPLCNGPKALLAPCHTLEPPRTQIPLVPVAPLAKDGAAVIKMVANATVMMTNAVLARCTPGSPTKFWPVLHQNDSDRNLAMIGPVRFEDKIVSPPRHLWARIAS